MWESRVRCSFISTWTNSDPEHSSHYRAHTSEPLADAKQQDAKAEQTSLHFQIPSIQSVMSSPNDSNCAKT